MHTTPTRRRKSVGRPIIELALFDCVCHMHQAGGLASVAGAVQHLGARADPRRLAKVATQYDSVAVRRLGYLLESSGHIMQARALRAYAESAEPFEPLDPDANASVAEPAQAPERDSTWKLLINEVVAVDA
jgi:predicted transcriptional regulator of viral defense system